MKLAQGLYIFKDNVVMLYSVDHNSYPGFQKCFNRNDNLGRRFTKVGFSLLSTQDVVNIVTALVQLLASCCH